MVYGDGPAERGREPLKKDPKEELECIRSANSRNPFHLESVDGRKTRVSTTENSLTIHYELPKTL